MTEYIEWGALRDAVESIDWYSVLEGKLTTGANIENALYKANDIYSAIDNAPTADVAPVRRGKWLEWFPGDCALIMTGEEKLYRCSICDAKYPDVEGFNFCPHCGNPIDSKSIHAKLPSNPNVRSYGEMDADA